MGETDVREMLCDWAGAGRAQRGKNWKRTDVREMLCDWAGAGKARQGKNWTRAAVRHFYTKHRDKMVLSAKTVELIEKNLDSMGF